MNRRAFLLTSTALVAPGAAGACLIESTKEVLGTVNQTIDEALEVIPNENVRTLVKYGGVTIASTVVVAAAGATAPVSILAGVSVGTVSTTIPYIRKVQSRSLEQLVATFKK